MSGLCTLEDGSGDDKHGGCHDGNHVFRPLYCLAIACAVGGALAEVYNAGGTIATITFAVTIPVPLGLCRVWQELSRRARHLGWFRSYRYIQWKYLTLG